MYATRALRGLPRTWARAPTRLLGHAYPDVEVALPDLEAELRTLAQRPQRAVRMAEMLQWGHSRDGTALMREFLLDQLPVRIARRTVELQSLPHNLSAMPAVQRVFSWYESSFQELRRFTASNNLKNVSDAEFTALLERVLARHNDVVPTIARGIVELKRVLSPDEASIVDGCPFLQDFLDRFFMARIGIRTLIHHYIGLQHPRPGFSGAFQEECPIADVVRIAADDAGMVCERVLGRYPEVRIRGALDLKATYIPEHIHHVMFELLKNSMRAIVETHSKEIDLPDVDVVLSNGETDIAIKVSDQGGGIPRADIRKIFTYSYTTMKDPPLPESSDSSDTPQLAGLTTAPMAGYGYGLPLSRLYSHVFGGDLIVISLHGHGTDAYLFFNHLNHSTEIVPR